MDATTAPSTRFDIIPYSDLSPESSWVRLGKGSFGSVFKGEYLGLTVAIKEVLESKEYDVEKYFARECKIMQESRHPNIVQYIGLSLAPLPASGSGRARQRILIISEFLPHGNLRTYILSSSSTHPFPWPLRLSFATDVARGLAYLHARRCLHRDLKGENLLITENNRVKLCDFGFARLEARGEEEKRRLSYCGTDGYMSPEMVMGLPFGLETDIFSLGVIFAEIACREMVEGEIFRRDPPTFTLDPVEVYSRASPRCPPALLSLAIACTAARPEDRPTITAILQTLRSIEASLPEDEGTVGHIGSVSFALGRAGSIAFDAQGNKRAKRPGFTNNRIPSFEGSVSVSSFTKERGAPPGGKENTRNINDTAAASHHSSEAEEAAALARLEQIPLLSGSSSNLNSKTDSSFGGPDNYSVVRLAKDGGSGASSTISDASTIRFGNNAVNIAPPPGRGSVGGSSLPSIPSAWLEPPLTTAGSGEPTPATQDNTGVDALGQDQAPLESDHVPVNLGVGGPDFPSDSEIGSIQTCRSVEHGGIEGDSVGADIEPDVDQISLANATVNGGAEEDVFVDAQSTLLYTDDPFSSPSTPPGFSHRFTLVQSGWKFRVYGAYKPNGPAKLPGGAAIPQGAGNGLWNGAFAKCGVCTKRLGLGRAYLQCDDCVLKCHIACSDGSPRNCSGIEAGIIMVPPPPPLRTALIPITSAPLPPTRKPPSLPSSRILGSS